MSEFTGYNPAQVEALMDSVNKISKSIGNDISTSIQSGIVNPMKGAWFTPEGKGYFDEFEKALRKAGPVIEEVLNAFNQGLKAAADNWRDNTKSPNSRGAKEVRFKKVSTINLKITNSLLESDNGRVGIIESQALGIANRTTEIRREIEQKLKNQASSLEASSAFLGKNQAVAVQNCFTKIQDEVAKIFKFLDEDGEGQSLRTAIESAVRKYGDVGQAISTEFNKDI